MTVSDMTEEWLTSVFMVRLKDEIQEELHLFRARDLKSVMHIWQYPDRVNPSIRLKWTKKITVQAQPRITILPATFTLAQQTQIWIHQTQQSSTITQQPLS